MADYTRYILILYHLRLAKLLTDSDGIQRIFIDEFSPHSEFIGASILQFFESIMVNDSCENLRSKYVLNPTFDGDNMSGPSKMKVLSIALTFTMC